MFGSQTHNVSMDHVKSASLKQEHHAQSSLHGCSFLGITWATTDAKSKDKPMPTVYACLGGMTINDNSPDPRSARNKLLGNIAGAIDAQLTALGTAPVDVTYVYATLPSRSGWSPQHSQANTVVHNYIKSHFEGRRIRVNIRMVAYKNTNTTAGVSVSYYPHYVNAREGPVSIA